MKDEALPHNRWEEPHEMENLESLRSRNQSVCLGAFLMTAGLELSVLTRVGDKIWPLKINFCVRRAETANFFKYNLQNMYGAKFYSLQSIFCIA